MAENGFEAMQRQRMEKDLLELQTLIGKHFEKRKDDDDDLSKLEARITKRREEREKQMKIRKEREQTRLQREKEDRARREEEEQKRVLEDEERKKKAIQNMGASYGGYLARNENRKGAKKQTNREIKRKVLAERRKALNIDHLSGEKLKDKAGDLFKWLKVLEEERYDFEVTADRAKYDINALRQRVSEYMQKSGKGGKSGAGRSVKTLANVGAKAAAFK